MKGYSSELAGFGGNEENGPISQLTLCPLNWQQIAPPLTDFNTRQGQAFRDRVCQALTLT